MALYEYKVIPAPTKGRKAPGVKRPEARFAHGLQELMNELAAEGWEYQRADVLPSDERQGLTSTQTVYRSVLVFRRARHADAAPDITLAAPVSDSPAETPAPETASDSDDTVALTASPAAEHGPEPEPVSEPEPEPEKTR